MAATGYGKDSRWRLWLSGCVVKYPLIVFVECTEAANDVDGEERLILSYHGLIYHQKSSLSFALFSPGHRRFNVSTLIMVRFDFSSAHAYITFCSHLYMHIEGR